MKKVKVLASIVLNVAIFGLVIMSTVFMLTGYRFMGDDLVLSANKVQAFKYFTVDSNLLMGAIAALFAVFEILLLVGKRENLPTWLYIVKHMGTVGVVLTFLTTACFLAPFLVDDYWILFKNSNLFFHAVIPLMSLATWVFLEDTDRVAWRYSFIGMIPMGVYAVFYCATALSHVVDGKVPYEYDWYGFVQGGVGYAAVSLPLMLGATYLIAYLLWLCNRAVARKTNKGAQA